MNELVNLKHLTPPAIKSHLNSHQMLCDNYRGKCIHGYGDPFHELSLSWYVDNLWCSLYVVQGNL
jgi:hypothetical protein